MALVFDMIIIADHIFRVLIVPDFVTYILENNLKISFDLKFQTVALPIVNDNPRFVSTAYLMT
jgi:hypothetical protein